MSLFFEHHPWYLTELAKRRELLKQDTNLANAELRARVALAVKHVEKIKKINRLRIFENVLDPNDNNVSTQTLLNRTHVFFGNNIPIKMSANYDNEKFHAKFTTTAMIPKLSETIYNEDSAISTRNTGGVKHPIDAYIFLKRVAVKTKKILDEIQKIADRIEGKYVLGK